MFGGNDKKNKDNKDKKQGGLINTISRDDYIQDLKGLVPKYAKSARTSAVLSVTGRVYFRCAHVQPDGTWQVLTVKFLDLTGDEAKRNLGFQDQSTENPDGKDGVKMMMDVDLEPYVRYEDDQEIKKTNMTYAEAMSLLADIEFKVLMGQGAYQVVDDSILQDKEGEIQKAMFANLDQDNEFLQTVFFGMDHFLQSTKREGLKWRTDGLPIMSEDGLPRAPGRYLDVEWADAHNSRIETIEAPSQEESPLGALFGKFANVNLDARIKALRALNVMDNFIDSIADLKTNLQEMLDSGNVDIEKFDQWSNAVREKLNEAENKGQWMRDMETKVAYVEMLVMAHMVVEYNSQISSDVSKAEVVGEKIKSLVSKIQDRVDTYNFGADKLEQAKQATANGENYETAVSVIDSLIADYRAERASFKKDLDANMRISAEKRQKLSEPKPAVKKSPKAPKAAAKKA